MDDFVSGLQALKASMDEVALLTGSVELDGLLGGGLKLGCLHLFYGDTESGVDELLHRIVANSLLPRERGGLGGKAIYLNCGNYRREKTILDTRFLTWLLRASELDPSRALEDIYVICSFSPEQQEDAVFKAKRLVESDGGVRLIAVHNIAKLFTSDQRKRFEVLERIPMLQKVVLNLWRTCAEEGIVLAATCRPNRTSRVGIPQPEGGRYLRHMSGVVVYLRREGKAASAYLVKHPGRAPRRIDLSFGGGVLGRIIGSFRIQFQEVLAELEESFVKALRDEGRRGVFSKLVEAWGGEMGAMGNANVPTVLDVMLLTAIIDNRRRVEELGRKVEELRSKIMDLSEGFGLATG